MGAHRTWSSHRGKSGEGGESRESAFGALKSLVLATSELVVNPAPVREGRLCHRLYSNCRQAVDSGYCLELLDEGQTRADTLCICPALCFPDLRPGSPLGQLKSQTIQRRGVGTQIPSLISQARSRAASGTQRRELSQHHLPWGPAILLLALCGRVLPEVSLTQWAKASVIIPASWTLSLTLIPCSLLFLPLESD